MYTVYSKGTSCPYCVKAKELLKQKNEKFTVILIPDDISRDELLEITSSANENITNDNLTVPQVFKESDAGTTIYIGGHDDLVDYFKNKEEQSAMDFSQLEI